MCRVLEVSRSGYYAWLVRPVSNRASSNNKLLKEIRRAHVESRKTYGSPRITRKLQKEGISCSKNRVARLMSSHGIVAKTKRKFKATRTLSTIFRSLRTCLINALRPTAKTGFGSPISPIFLQTKDGFTWRLSRIYLTVRS